MDIVVTLGLIIFLGGLDFFRNIANPFENLWADASKLMMLITGSLFTYLCIQSFIFIDPETVLHASATKMVLDEQLLADIKSQLIKIAFPAGIGMMFHTFYNITDTFYAGLIGSEAIGAMAITFPVFFILLALAIGFSQGTTALISNYIGAKDLRSACEIYIQALIYSLIISIAVGLMIFYSSEWIFNFFGADGNFLLMAISYISVIALGAPFKQFATR